MRERQKILLIYPLLKEVREVGSGFIRYEHDWLIQLLRDESIS